MTRQSPAKTSTVTHKHPLQRAKPLEGPTVTQPATTQELIADVLYRHFTDDEEAYQVACEIERDPAIEIRQRIIIWGDRWEMIRDALDALPLGAQIRWRTGYPEQTSFAIQRRRGMWAEIGHVAHRSSETIARDNTPIEVIA